MNTHIQIYTFREGLKKCIFSSNFLLKALPVSVHLSVCDIEKPEGDHQNTPLPATPVFVHYTWMILRARASVVRLLLCLYLYVCVRACVCVFALYQRVGPGLYSACVNQ